MTSCTVMSQASRVVQLSCRASNIQYVAPYSVEAHYKHNATPHVWYSAHDRSYERSTFMPWCIYTQHFDNYRQHLYKTVRRIHYCSNTICQATIFFSKLGKVCPNLPFGSGLVWVIALRVDQLLEFLQEWSSSARDAVQVRLCQVSHLLNIVSLQSYGLKVPIVLL